MMKKILFLIVFLLLLNPLYAEMTPGDISYYTEEYPPYNFSDNDMATGFATEILLKMFEKLNVNKTAKDIRVVPWARGFNDIQKKKNVCLYTMTRTDERVKKYGFRWVGPIINTGSVLFAQKSKNIKINSMEDVKKYRVCAIRDDVAEQTIVRMGYSIDDVDRTASPVSIAKKILKDRCQLWPYGEIATKWILKKNGFNVDDFEVVYQLTEKESMFFAFNQRTPDSVVVPLQKAFDELKAEGVVDKIISTYLR